MQRNKISIAKKTLAQLEKKSWNKIIFTQIINNKHKNTFNSKTDLLININNYFDFLLRKKLVELEKSSIKDMLFEVIMARLDIINLHRKAIKNLIKYFSTNPHKFIKLIPSFLESIILISTLSNLDVAGVKGVPKIKAIFILYLLIIYSWHKDETPSLEKTMTTLDKYLINIDKFISLT